MLTQNPRTVVSILVLVLLAYPFPLPTLTVSNSSPAGQARIVIEQQGNITIPGHVVTVLQAAKPIGRVPDAMSVRLTLVLSFRSGTNPAAYVSSLYDPSSVNYRHFLSPQSFGNMFGPSLQDYQSVITWLSHEGFNITQTYTDRLSIEVQGYARSIQSAFGVSLLFYQYQNQTFFATSADPQIPAQLGGMIGAVVGLYNYSFVKPLLSKSSSLRPAAGGLPPYDPPDIRNAYDEAKLITKLDGAGQTIDILDWNDYPNLVSDLSVFDAHYGLPDPPSILKIPRNSPHTCPPTLQADGPCWETAMDTEWAHVMAPGANLHVVLVPDGSDNSLEDGISYIVKTDLASGGIFSNSWGQPEFCPLQGLPVECDPQFHKQVDALLMEAASFGISTFFASGDKGAYDSDPLRIIGVLTVEFPASDPWVTAVGGTTLESVNGPETAWGGSGGGVSQIWSEPPWQSRVLQTAGSMRGLPDVSMDADKGTGVSAYCSQYLDCTAADGKGLFKTVGGTSLSAPLWAGSTAVLNQMMGQNVGFLNPYLYSDLIYNNQPAPNYSSDFHDITSGDNGYYHASPQWDAVTGLGSPDLYNLFIHFHLGQPFDRSWGGPKLDRAEAVATDGRYLYVVGDTESFGAGGKDLAVIKFDWYGDEVWSKTWGTQGDEYAFSPIRVTDTAIYVGATGGNGATLLKFNKTSGELLWSKLLMRDQKTLWDISSISVDGNVIYIGSVDGLTLIKLVEHQGAIDQSSIQWALDLSNGWLEPGDVEVQGNYVYVAYKYSDRLGKFSTDGQLIWAKRLPMNIHDISVSDGIYAVGFGGLITKLNFDGKVLWAKHYSTPWDSGNGLMNEANAVFASDNRVYVAGTEYPSNTNSNGYLLTLDNSLNLLANKIYGGDQSTWFTDVTSSKGLVFAVGATWSPSRSWTAVVRSFDDMVLSSESYQVTPKSVTTAVTLQDAQGSLGSPQASTTYAGSGDMVIVSVEDSLWNKSPSNPVLNPTQGAWDAGGVEVPRVLYDGQTFRMWYCGGVLGGALKIGYATSTDGSVWTKYPNPVLTPGSPGTWDDYSVGQASVVWDGAEFMMWYEGISARNVKQGAFGLAFSSDGVSWTKYSGNPVMTPSGGSSTLSYPYVLKIANTFEMWYRTGPTWGIYYASSGDGIHWSTQASPVLAPGPASWDDGVVYSPSVIYNGISYWMFYSGAGSGSSYPEVGYATSSDGISWTKPSDNLIVTQGGPASWDNADVDNQDAIIVDGKVTLYYSGAHVTGGQYDRPYSIGLAQSPFGFIPGEFGASLAALGSFTGLSSGSVLLVIGDLTNNPHGSKPPGVGFQQGRDSTPLGFVSGMLINGHPSKFDTNPAVVDSSGRPIGSWSIVFAIGGPDVNAVTNYYETTGTAADRAPVSESVSGSNYVWTDRNGVVVLTDPQSSDSIPPGTSDVFVVQILQDTNGRLVAIMDGTTYLGTWAAALYFEYFIYPNITSYTNSYYVVRWTDATSGPDADFVPGLGDTFTILAQGSP
jgi:kumamolisin